MVFSCSRFILGTVLTSVLSVLAAANLDGAEYRNPVSAAAEEGIIRLLYLEPELNRTEALPDAQEFSSEALAKMYRLLRRKISDGDSLSIGTLSQELNQEEMNLLVDILYAVIDPRIRMK